jgi:CheY-like chemotaxis protein
MRGRILVVEDDPAHAKYLALVLGDAGFAITVADSGIGVPALARRSHPDAIVLDLGLPYRSGASLLADLKADPHTAQIPVVVLSGLSERLPDARRAMAASILRKPCPSAELIRAVASACSPTRVNQAGLVLDRIEEEDQGRASV